MLTWFTVNVVLSVIALVFIRVNDTAPHRLRFLAGFTAMAVWLVPWSLLPELLPANLFSLELGRMERAIQAPSTQFYGMVPIVATNGGTALAAPIVFSISLEIVFVALTFVGCILFARKVRAHQQLLRALEHRSGDGKWMWAKVGMDPICPVREQCEIVGAFSSGLLRPRIWIHSDLVHSPQLATVLRHELTHIRQHDNWYLLVITFVERVFWWNPLVWYLGRHTRELQELSCDELCQRSDSAYHAQLAQLMIDSARGGQRPRMLALGANIFNKPNPNLKRVQLLQRSYPMLKKHIFGAVLTAVSAFLAVSVVTAQPGEAQVAALPGIDPARLMRGIRAPEDAQFRREVVDGRDLLSLRFPNAHLSQVLMLLTGVTSPGSRPGMRGVAVVRSTGTDAVSRLSTPQLIDSLAAAGGAANWEQENRVVTFSPEFLVSDKLVLEAPAAADRRVTVDFTNLTLDEALAAIADASGCNIFQDGDTIVIDYCDE